MGNAKSMSSITSSSSREQVSTTTTTTTTATKTIRPTNIHIPFKPAVMMSTINSSRKFYLNLSELKSGSSNSGDQSTKLVSSSSFEPSPTSSYTDEEYTSLNEIIESIESFPNMTTTVRVDDNYANLDFKDENNNNKSSFFGDKPSNRFSTLFSQPIPKELDSQLYSNVRLISCDKLCGGGGERPKRRRAKLNQQQSSTLTECHKRISINLASLHLLTANLLSKLSKNVHKRPENASQQQSTKLCDNIETKKTSSTTKQSQNNLVILIPPPQKAFNPFHELDNTRKEEEEETAKKSNQSTSASNSFSNSSPSPSDLDDLVAEEIIDDDDEGFYQTLNGSSHHRNDYDNEIKPLNNNINNNNKYNELSDYDYLVSYEWPRTLPETTTTIPPPLPASSQPNRTQAILKFFEYN